jgi:hypothetical protein
MVNRATSVFSSIMLSVLAGCVGEVGQSHDKTGERSQATTIVDDVIIDGNLVVGDRAHIIAGLVVARDMAGLGGNAVVEGDVIAGISGSGLGDLLHERVRSIQIPGSLAVDPSYGGQGGCHTRMMQASGGTIGYLLSAVTQCPITYPVLVQDGDWIRGWRIHVVKGSRSGCVIRASLARMNGNPGEEEMLDSRSLSSAHGELIGVCHMLDEGCAPMTAVRVERGWQHYLVLWPCGETEDRALGAEVDFNRSGP